MVIYNYVFGLNNGKSPYTVRRCHPGVIIMCGNFVNIRQFKTIDVFKCGLPFAGPCQHMRRKLVAVYSINRTIATVKPAAASMSL